MPIDTEQWRAQTGLFYASRTPLKSPKYKKPEVDSASKLTNMLLAVVLMVLRIGASYASIILRQISSVLSLLPNLLSFGVSRKKLKRVGGIIGLLALTLIAVQMLLIMAGDVEQNPGPETPIIDQVSTSVQLPMVSGQPVSQSPQLLEPTMVERQPLQTQEGLVAPMDTTDNSLQATTKTQKSGSKRNQGIKRKRSQPCGVCPPCQKEDCGECKYCRDKPKFGGEGKLKQKCIRRQCKNMITPGGRRSRTLDELLSWQPQATPVSNEAQSSSIQNLTPVEEQSSSQDIAESQTQVSQRSSKQCKTLLEKALEQGFINTHITKVLINGPPGVGKSSLLRLLLGELMPNVRDSTDIAALGDRVYVQLIPTESDDKACYDRPIQMGMVHADGLYNWNHLDTKQQEELLAMVIDELDTDSDASEAIVTEQPEQDQEGSVQPSFGSGEATQSILQFLEKPKAKRNLSTIRFLCFMDTGGQPHFLEILPAFVRNTSINLVVFKLNEKLNYQPKFEYYKKGVRLQTRNSWLEVTNEQMIEQTARTLLSCMSKPLDPKDIKGLEVDNIPDKPKMMLIGTFKDKVDKCSETPEDKNKQLYKNDTLKPVIDNGVMIVSDDGLIFQVDASKRGCNTSKNILDEIKQKILKKSGSMVLKIPVRWYLLQLELMRAAQESQWKLLNIEDCYRIGVQLGNMTKEEVSEALKYFNELNIFLHYPEVMPEAVFCDPQHLVKKVSDLIVASFPGSGCFFEDVEEGTRSKLHRKGLFTLDLLNLDCFDMKCDTGLFTVEKFVNLLEHLNIIAKVVEEPRPKYFIPCVLRRIRVNEHTRRSKWAIPNDRVDPLLIYFPSGWSPRGLFCALIVSLTSLNNSPQWIITTNEKKYSPSRNLIEFKVGRKRGTVIIVDAMKWFEVHTSGNLEDCQEIRRKIHEKIEEILPKFFYERSEVAMQDGFFCNIKTCEITQLHAAKVEYDEQNCCYLTCTEGHRDWEDITEKQLVWLTNDQESDGPSSPKCPRLNHSLDDQPKLRDLMEFKGSLKKINILQEIGSNYCVFGTMLLADDTGSKVDSIIREYNNRAMDINRKIVVQWLQGGGKEPITWATLIEVLNTCDLCKLASIVKTALS